MRTRDRLAELRQRAEAAAGTGDGPAPPAEPRAAGPVDALLEEVRHVHGWIHELDSNTQLMRRLHADPTYHTNKHLQEQLDAAVTASNAAGLKVCGALRQLEARVSRHNDACARVARLQYATTRRLYTDALARHRELLDAVRDRQLRLLHEQLRLTNLTISDEECQALLDTNNMSLFVDNVGADTAEARRALRDVEARHEELARVEAALRDVRDLFAQLAHLVAAQQDQVDSVEYYALQATEHVGTGGHQLLKGTVSRTRARKKKVSVVVCVAVGVAVVLVVLALT